MIAAKSFNKKYKKKNFNRRNDAANGETKKSESGEKPFKFKCHKCHEIEHKASECKQTRQIANKTEDINLYASTELNAYKVSSRSDDVDNKL